VSSIEPEPSASAGTRPGEVALGEVAARLGEPPQRGRKSPGQHRRDDHGDEERREADDREQASDVRDGGRPERIRVRERDLHRIGRRLGAQDHDEGIARDRLPQLARRWCLLLVGDEFPVRGRREDVIHHHAELDPDVGLGKAFGEDLLLGRVRQLEGDRRIDDVQRADDRMDPAGGRVGDDRDVLGDAPRPGLQVVALLLVEVRPDAIDDECRDDRHRDRHDGDERPGSGAPGRYEGRSDQRSANA